MVEGHAVIEVMSGATRTMDPGNRCPVCRAWISSTTGETLPGHGEEPKPVSIWFMNERYHAGKLVSTASAAMMDAADTP